MLQELTAKELTEGSYDIVLLIAKSITQGKY